MNAMIMNLVDTLTVIPTVVLMAEVMLTMTEAAVMGTLAHDL